jgi:hypothetical protein
MRSIGAGTQRMRAGSICGGDFRFRWREGAGGFVGSHMLQHVRCRLKGRLTNHFHADRVPAIVACHESAACDASSRGVHASSLLSIGGQCRGHWYST